MRQMRPNVGGRPAAPAPHPLETIAARHEALAALHASDADVGKAQEHAAAAALAFANLEAIDPRWLDELRVDLPAFCAQYGIPEPQVPPMPADQPNAGVLATRYIKAALDDRHRATIAASPANARAQLDHLLASAELRAAAAGGDVTAAARDLLTRLHAAATPEMQAVIQDHPTWKQLGVHAAAPQEAA